MKDGHEDVKQAICCANTEDNVEDEHLPALSKYTQEEEAERDFQECCCKDVEDFAELHVD